MRGISTRDSNGRQNFKPLACQNFACGRIETGENLATERAAVMGDHAIGKVTAHLEHGQAGCRGSAVRRDGRRVCIFADDHGAIGAGKLVDPPQHPVELSEYRGGDRDSVGF